MNGTLLKALIALTITVALLFASVVAFVKERKVSAFLQLFGAGCLIVVAFVHICEALRWFPRMGFGLEHSIGHYLDLSSALVGLTLLPVRYLLRKVKPSHS